MSEQQFNESERLRVESERRKESYRNSTPAVGSADEYVEASRITGGSGNLAEFIRREHSDFKANVALLEHFYERKLSEQTQIVAELNAQVQSLTHSLHALTESFNTFRAQSLAMQNAHVAQVAKTCEALEKELNY